MTSFSKIKHPIQYELEHFCSLFDETLSSNNPVLNEVLSYVLQRKGKMMRPVLVLLIGKLLGEINEKTFNTAIALELLHTASLVHDDIVDESNERRGQPSVNFVYNNKVSVLTGDYLLANCLMKAAMTKDNIIISEISSLGKDLSEGEVLQLSSIADEIIDEKKYFDIIKKKTAALFSTCAKTAALSVGAKPEDVQTAYNFGENLGICFQIKDDIFDYFNDEEMIGKPTGNDMREGKLTLPAIYALKITKNKDFEILAHKIKKGKASDSEIHTMIEFSKSNGGIEYATEKMISFKNKAAQFLASYENNTVKESLLLYLEKVVNRNK